MADKPYPPIGQNVEVTLASGSTLTAYWDGTQWWAGVQDDANDVPVANGYVVDWTLPG